MMICTEKLKWHYEICHSTTLYVEVHTRLALQAASTEEEENQCYYQRTQHTLIPHMKLHNHIAFGRRGRGGTFSDKRYHFLSLRAIQSQLYFVKRSQGLKIVRSQGWRGGWVLLKFLSWSSVYKSITLQLCKQLIHTCVVMPFKGGN